jgi:hypothetical protein
MIKYLAPLLPLVLVLACGGSPTPPHPPGGPPAPKAEKPAPPRPAAKAPKPALTPEQELDQTMRELKVRLALKPNQVAPVRAILKDSQDKKAQIEKDQGPYNSVNAMMRMFEEMSILDRQTLAALGKVLSSDQVDAYKKYLREQRKRFDSITEKGGPTALRPPPLRGSENRR